MRARFGTALLFVLLFGATAAFAQRPAGHELGFNPDSIYQKGDIDTVSLMNGNLTVTVPLGFQYRVGGGLSYQLKLVYNGKIWDFQRETDGFNSWTIARPNLHSNAGTGWRLSLGKILPPRTHSKFAFEQRLRYVYEGPAGDEHVFWAWLPGDDPTVESPPDAPVQFSRESRLRMTKNGGTIKIEFPSGEIHTFTEDSHGEWRLQRQEDRFGNWLTVTYTPDPQGGDAAWIIKDSQGREHVITFVNHVAPEENIYKGQMVSSVTLGARSGTTVTAHAVYSFAYQDRDVGWGCGTELGGFTPAAPDTFQTTRIPLLTGVSLAGGGSYGFDYHVNFSAATCEQGTLKKLTHPTGAETSYSYQQYFIPAEKCHEVQWHDRPVGIRTRTTEAGTWNYIQGYGQKVNVFPIGGLPQDRGCGQDAQGKFIAPRQPRRWSRTTVLSPPAPTAGFDGIVRLTRTRTDHYFDVWNVLEESDPIGVSVDEHYLYKHGGAYAAPPAEASQAGVTHGQSQEIDEIVADSDRRWLVSRTFEGCASDDSGDCSDTSTHRGRLVRSEYKSVRSSGATVDTVQLIGSDVVTSTKTVYEDDSGCGGKCEQVWSYDEFNEVSETGKVVASSNFPDAADLTTTTEIPDWTSDDLRDTETTAWIFGTYTTITRSQVKNGNTETKTEESCFDKDTGFLMQKRVWRGAVPGTLGREAAPGDTDFLVVYSDKDASGSNADGNPSIERHYGGDKFPLSSVTFACGQSNGTPRFTVHHDYAFGVRKKSRFLGAEFNDLDLEIQPTGLVSSSLDAAGRKTTYKYDVEGRPLEMHPPGEAAWTKFTYNLTTDPLQVTVRQYASTDSAGTTPLTDSRYYYDLLGRMKQQKRRMPSGWSTRTYTSDALGRRSTASVAEYTSDPTFSTATTSKVTEFTYDAFGRVVAVKEPDASGVTTSYTGVRQLARTIHVATVDNPDGEVSTTTETYDEHGRLVSVKEPAGENGTDTITTYQYDPTGQLTLVSSGEQTREFRYTGGSLAYEDHPETAPIQYQYDAGGLLVQKDTGTTLSVEYVYDALQRLKSVKDLKSDKVLKDYTYEDDEPRTPRTQTRHNPVGNTTYSVIDEFTYDSATGRVAEKKTTIEKGDTETGVFTYPFAYTQLGALDRLQYPTCTECGTAAPERSLDLDYDQGLLTGIENVTTTPVDPEIHDEIEYTAAGAVHTVQHATQSGAAGILDRFNPDTITGMARIASITFDRASACALIQTQPVNTVVQSGPPVEELIVTVVNGSTVQWYEGVTGDKSRPVHTGAVFPLINIPHDKTFWASVTDGTCEDRSVTVTVTLKTCPTSEFAISPNPSDVVEGETFKLVSPTFAGATYRWYEGSASSKQLLGTTTEPEHVIQGGIQVEKQYFAEVDDPECGATTQQSAYLVVTPCRKPAQQFIIVTPVPDTGEFELSVPLEPDVTLEWFEGSSHADVSKPLGTASPVTVAPTRATHYWVRMTRTCNTAKAVTNSGFVLVDPACQPFILTQPEPAVAAMPALNAVGQISATVRAGGSGPFDYKWYDLDGNLVSETATFTWQYTRTDANAIVAWKDVHVWVSQGASRVKSKTIRLQFVPTPQRIKSSSGSLSVYGDLQPATFFVEMEPAPVEDVHGYTYKWYGSDGGEAMVLPGSGSSKTVNFRAGHTYWVEITGEHTEPNGVVWTHTTVSPKMYVLLYAACDLPPVEIEQSLTAICDLSLEPDVTFRALVDWPNVDFQWYAGQPGDTSSPLASDAGNPHQLTVVGDRVRKVWVRASLPCGTTRDSEVAYYTRGDCEPVLVDEVIPSVEVEWNGSTELSITPLVGEGLRYTWLSGTQHFIERGQGTTLPLSGITTSQRYHVMVEDPDCLNSAGISNTATVRVASAEGITPPVWETEVWMTFGEPITLSAQSVGASAYEWYSGEVGDDSVQIHGATHATYSPGELTADAKFWVRVFGGGKSLDSPTITVKVCYPPVVVNEPNFDRTIAKNQVMSFSVDPSGTDVQYQWYQGPFGDVASSTPVGRNVDRLQVSPSATTSYWLHMSNRCGSTQTYIDANEVAHDLKFTASVCPFIDGVSAAKTTVMPGTTTTVTVAVSGTNYTYQWFIGAKGVTTHPIAGATTTSMTTPPITASTTFWCRVTSGDCAIDSDAVTVNLCDGPRVTWNVQNREKVELNEFQILGVSIDAAEQPVTMSWYAGVSGDLANSHLIHTGSSGHGVTASSTKQYWFRAGMGTNGCYADTPTLTVQVCIPKITAHPQPATLDKAANPNASATLSITTDATPATVQWYIGASGDVSQPIAGQTAKTLTVSPASDTTYWARVTGTCAVSRDSTAATVTVCNPPVISNVTPSKTVQSGSTTSISVSATGTDLTYQWYRGNPGDTTNPLTNATWPGTTLNPTTTATYWCRVTSRGTCWKDSGGITITVCNPSSITTQPVASQKIFAGGSATLSVTATSGGAMTWQWYTGVTGNVSSPISGATSTSITVTPAASTNYWVRITNAVCTTDSATANVSICAYPANVAGGERLIGYNESASLSLPALSPSAEKTIRWYRGAVGDKTALVKSGTGVNLTYDTPPLTQNTNYWAEFDHDGCTSRTAAFTVRVCKPAITTQPAGTTIAPGSSWTMSVAATPIAGQTYQWYSGAVGTTTNPVAGGTSASITVTPASTTSYWVRVTGTCGFTADSAAATVTVCSAPAISSVSPAQSIRSGTSTTVSVSATGTSLTYQWYIGASGTTTAPVSGGTTAQISVAPTATTTYWCRVTSQGLCTANSATTTVSVCNPPSITTQPLSQKVFSGTPVTLSVTATAGGAMTYQWYVGSSGDVSNPISGATNATVTVNPASLTNYWVRVKTSVCTTDSQTATISHCTYSPVWEGGERLIGYNESTSLSLPAKSPVYEKSITWYRGNVGDRSTPVKTGIGTNLTYDTPPHTQTTLYWAEFQHEGCTTRTDVYTVRVCEPAITTQPAGTTLAPGSQWTMSVAATPISGQTYQWYTGTPGTTTSPVSEATSASLTVSPASTTTYWVRVSGTCGVVADSTAATITVCNPPAISSVSPNRFIESGDSTSVTVTATGTSLTYQWYTGARGVTTSPVSGGTTASISVSPAATTTYWCRIKSYGLCPVDSAAITVDVCTNPVITTQPVSQRIFHNASATLSVTATSSRPLTYQWYTGTSGSTSSPISGATGASLTVTPTVETSYWVRITTSVCTVDSATATISFCTFGPTVSIAATRDIVSGGSTTLTFPPMSPVVEKRITWYRGVSGDRSNPVRTATGTSLDYTTPSHTADTPYWLEFEHNGCITVSNTTTVRVCKPTITSHPQSSTVLSGSAKTLSVTATGSPLTYQWYLGNSGDTTQPIAGATSASYTVTPAATTSYWVRVTGCSTTANSATAILTVCTLPVVDSLTKTTNSDVGTTGKLTVIASGGTTLSYQWYKGQSGDTSRPIAGATANVYSFTLQASEYYWVRVTSACDGSSINSAAILYSVQPKITQQPASTTVCSLGDPVTLSVTATGTDLTYEWRRDGVLLEPTTASITVPTTVLPANYYVIVKSGTATIRSVDATVTATGRPTILSISKSSLGSGQYLLSTNLSSADEGADVSYAWFKGPLGDTTYNIYNMSAVKVTPTPPVTYWVRVTYTATGCASSKAYSFY